MSTRNETDFSQHRTVDSPFTLAKSFLLCAMNTCHYNKERVLNESKHNYTTKFVRCSYLKLTTCFGPCCRPSSGHKSIYSRKLYSISHNILVHQSKTQRDLVVVQYSNAVHD